MVFVTSALPVRQEADRSDRKEKAKDKTAVERALSELLATFAPHERALSPWERHCLWAALTFLRFGYFSQALLRIRDVLDPPLPLPPFPTPRALTLDDVRRHLSDSREGGVLAQDPGTQGPEEKNASSREARHRPDRSGDSRAQ